MQRPDEPEVNLEQILERLRTLFGRFGGGGGPFVYVIAAVIIVGVIIWFATGLYSVQPGQVAVVQLFGKYHSETTPGLHFFWPSPVGRTTIVSVDEVRRLELGFRGEQTIPAESLMITGDENIVDVRLLVQFDIKDASDFLFKVVDPNGITMRDIAETIIRQVVGERDIDDVLTTEKEAVQADTKIGMQMLLDRYQSGINIRDVKLQGVNPPSQVQDAFDDVVRAKEDKERIINLADAYEEDIIPRARGEAKRQIQAAEAYKAQRVNLATGEAERFNSILQEYRKAPDITRQRLYLEAMEEILPGVTKYIVDSGTSMVVVTGDQDRLPGILPVPGNGE